eukprot:10972732-Ditylum_brightwellii.AAC.1
MALVVILAAVAMASLTLATHLQLQSLIVVSKWPRKLPKKWMGKSARAKCPQLREMIFRDVFWCI